VEKAGITIGDFITRSGEGEQATGHQATGAGFDNRVGCAVLDRDHEEAEGFKGTVYAAGTIQEEIGLIG